MRIRINQKFIPFTNLNGCRFLICNTDYTVQIFPTLLKFKSINKKNQFDIYLDILGPVKNFTAAQDLKRGRIRISGTSQQGYFSYLIKYDQIYFEKVFKNGIGCTLNKKQKVKAKDAIALPIRKVNNNTVKEILSLGIFKKQNIEDIAKRENLAEILPMIFLLAQYLDVRQQREKPLLIKDIEELLENKNRLGIENAFYKLIKVHFTKAFVPRIFDDEYQGIVSKALKDYNPLYLLQKTKELIRAIFIQEKKDVIEILSNLPISLHSGRLIDIQVSFGTMDIEWSKKLIKKIIIKSKKEAKIKLKLQSKIKSFRIKKSKKEKGKKMNRDESLFLETDKNYYLDNFLK